MTIHITVTRDDDVDPWHRDHIAEGIAEYMVSSGFRDVKYYDSEEDLKLSLKRDQYNGDFSTGNVPSLWKVLRQNNPSFFDTPIVVAVKPTLFEELGKEEE